MSTSIGFYGHHRRAKARKQAREATLVRKYGKCQCVTPDAAGKQCKSCHGRVSA